MSLAKRFWFSLGGVSLCQVELGWIFAWFRFPIFENYHQAKAAAKCTKCNEARKESSSRENYWNAAEVERNANFDQSALPIRSSVPSFGSWYVVRKSHACQLWPYVTLTKVYMSFCCFLCFPFGTQTVSYEQITCCKVRMIACWGSRS